jgi:hypothetical protein
MTWSKRIWIIRKWSTYLTTFHCQRLCHLPIRPLSKHKAIFFPPSSYYVYFPPSQLLMFCRTSHLSFWYKQRRTLVQFTVGLSAFLDAPSLYTRAFRIQYIFKYRFKVWTFWPGRTLQLDPLNTMNVQFLISIWHYTFHSCWYRWVSKLWSLVLWGAPCSSGDKIFPGTDIKFLRNITSCLPNFMMSHPVEPLPWH